MPKYRPLSKYPAIGRDIAVVLDEAVPAEEVKDCIGQSGSDMLKSVTLFDRYCGKGVGAGKKSLAFSITFHDMNRTLQDSEIDALMSDVMAALKRRFNATYRQ